MRGETDRKCAAIAPQRMKERMTGEHSVSADYSCSFWEQLEDKYTLVIEGNKATASDGGERVALVTAILGTSDADLQIFGPLSNDVLNMKIKAPQEFTDSNLTASLKEACLFILAQREMALATVTAEDN